MGDPPTARPAATTTTGIPSDLPCARCGYNLRTLATDALCPECATPVSRSLGGLLLRFADPVWLARLEYGAAFLLAYVALRVVASLLTACAGSASAWYFYLIWLVDDIVGVAAVFLLTTPQLPRHHEEPSARLRHALRGLCVFAAFARYAWVVAPVAATIPAAAGGVITSLANLLLVIGVLHFLRRLALRIPDAGLESSTLVVMAGLGLTVAGGVFMHVLLLALGVGEFSRLASDLPLKLIGFLLSFGGVIFGIWFLVLLVRYVGAFRHAADQASRLQQRPTTESEST